MGKFQLVLMMAALISLVMLIEFVIWMLFPGVWSLPGKLALMTSNQRSDVCLAEGKLTRDECVRIATGGQ